MLIPLSKKNLICYYLVRIEPIHLSFFIAAVRITAFVFTGLLGKSIYLVLLSWLLGHKGADYRWPWELSAFVIVAAVDYTN